MPARVRRAASSASRIIGMGNRFGAVIGVRMKPGQTAWTRRPSRREVASVASAQRWRAALEAE